jgi:amidase
MDGRRWLDRGLAALALALWGCDSGADAAAEGVSGIVGAAGAASPAAPSPSGTGSADGTTAPGSGLGSGEAPALPGGIDSELGMAGSGDGAGPPGEPSEPPPGELELVEASIAELRLALATRLVTPAELARMYLARIAAFDDDGPALNSFLFVNPDAVADAEALGTRCEAADAPPLCGIPVVVKDNIDTFDMPTTAGSVALEGSLPASDAFVSARLRAAGAVIIGKATLSEFANFLATGMPSGYSSLGGFGYNPYDPRPQPGSDGRPVLTPGGSSSGSSVAVSANLASVGIGTETSGSILSPASSNGIVGIKPTLGLVSRAGIIPISADQDTAGPLARTVRDAALVLGVIAGFDAADPATSPCLEPGNCESDYTRFLDEGALGGARIAVPPFANSRASVMNAAIEVLEARGASVEAIDTLQPQRSTCTTVPAGNNCSTVLTYGFKRDLNAYLAATPAAPVRTLADIIAFNAATEGALRYGQQLALAAEALDTAPGSADSARYEADRAQALASARAALDAVYAGDDGVLGTDDDVDAILFSENSGAGAPAIAGYPSISVPGGFLPATGAVQNPFPSGVTFSGPAFSEPRLIALAYAFEQVTQGREPPASTPALPSDRVTR